MSMAIHAKMAPMFKVTQEVTLMLIVATTETLKAMEEAVEMNTALMAQPTNQTLVMVVSTTTKMVLATPMTANQSLAKVGSYTPNPSIKRDALKRAPYVERWATQNQGDEK